MKSDFVMLSWNDDTFDTLPVDAYIIPFEDGLHYSLLEPYAPDQKNDAEWHFEPQFHHPKMYLSKVTFKRPSQDTAGNDITYIDWPFTGSVSSLLSYFCEKINEVFGFENDEAFGYTLCDFGDKVISCTFSSQDVLSALTNAANVCECEWHIDWELRTIYFGLVVVDKGLSVPQLEIGKNANSDNVRNTREGYWNGYEPQGSVRNIMRKSASEEFVQSDVRLSIDRSKQYTFRDIDGTLRTMEFPDGIIYTDGTRVISKQEFLSIGMRAYIKPLVYEDVYPRNDLYISHVRYREEYLLDENKQKVVAYTDDEGVVHYLKYAKWYFRLSRNIGTKENPNWADYGIKQNVWLQAQVLSVTDVVEDGHQAKKVKLSPNVRYRTGMYTNYATYAIARIKDSDTFDSACNDVMNARSNELVNNNANPFDYWPDLRNTYNYGFFVGGCNKLNAVRDPENNYYAKPVTPFPINDEQRVPYTERPQGTLSWSQLVRLGYVVWSWNESWLIMPGTTPVTYESTFHYGVDKRFIVGIKCGSVETTCLYHSLDFSVDMDKVESYLQSYFEEYNNVIELTLTPEQYEEFAAQVEDSQVRFQLTSGYDIEKFPDEQRTIEIINGTKPYIAFQPNTYRVDDGQGGYIYAESTPLAGLGGGDGNGHYGFALRSLHIEQEKDSSYIDDIKREPTEEGDSGLCDINGNRTTDIDDRWFEVEFEQNGTVITPSVREQGIIPKSDHNSPNAPTFFANMANVYNVVTDESSEYAAQVELIERTIEYIVGKLKDNNSYNIKSNPVVFEEELRNGNTDYQLYIGREVRYNNANGLELNTRVLKLVTKIDYPFEQEITVGNETLKGSRQELSEKVDALISVAEGGFGMSAAQVRTMLQNWVTPRFLSKVEDDVAQGKITFADLVKFGNFLRIVNGDAEDTGAAIYPDGLADIMNLVVRGAVKGTLNVEDLLNAGKIVFSSILSSKDAIAGYIGGSGITMDAETGKIQADSLEVRGFMRVMELVINKLQLMTSDYSFTEGGEVTHISTNSTTGELTLMMKKEHNNDVTPFAVGDIVYGKVNDLQSHGSYYTSWMRITAVDTQANTLTAVLYNGEDVPGGTNFSPYGTETNENSQSTLNRWYDDGDYDCMMNITRHGNITNTERQQAWVLSTTDKRLTFFWNVDKPIVEPYNYALCLGILPDLPNLPSTRDRSKPSLYVDTIFYDHSHQANFPAKIVKEDRGAWTNNPTSEYEGVTVREPYHKETFTNVTWLTYRNNPMYSALTDAQLRAKMLQEWKVDLETSRVWNDGKLWECIVDETAQEPKHGCTDWKVISGDTNYHCYVDQSLGGQMAQGETETETVSVYWGEENITAKFTNYSVTRNSGDPASDAQWNLLHTDVGNPFTIAWADLRVDDIRKKTDFVVTATDESANLTASRTLEFE